MAKKPNQKAKLVYLAMYLLDNTDADHTVSIPDMINYLSENGIAAERKSLYDDIEALRLCGLDIVMTKSPKTGYFIASRRFELPELQLLSDAVRSSKFITVKKSAELMAKLGSLCSIHEKNSLSGDIVVPNRVKNMNESIYINVDGISRAITEDKKISFSYFEWNANKERVIKHGGERYLVSPVALIWSNENYYLIALENGGEIRHFRVDKMLSIRQADEKRIPAPKDLDISSYDKKVFGMYGGRTESVTLLCDNSLAGVFIDRFGTDSVFRKRKDRFEITVKAEISPVFLSWLFAFGDKVKIISPEGVREEFIFALRKASENY